MAASNANADAIVSAMRSEIAKFYQLSGGGIEAIGLLFSEMAKQPLPPQVVCNLLGLNEDAVKKAFEAGEQPSATEDQLINAIKSSVDPEDTLDMYQPVIARHIKRFENARSVMVALTPKLNDFHKQIGGDVKKVAAFFSDLTPPPQKGQPMPPGMINMLLRIDPEATTCKCEDFLSCLERNMDATDTVDVIMPVLEQHIRNA